jgi:hypothetical protein
MSTSIILCFVGITTILLWSVYHLINKIKEIKSNYDGLESTLLKKVDQLLIEKEKTLDSKIETITCWEKYIHLNIGDAVYYEHSLILGKGGKSELSFKALVEGEIIDMTDNKVKIKLIDVSINTSNSSVKKQEVIDFITNHQPWIDIDLVQKRISVEDRRDMQLNKILNK